jgi:hypothetical protein
MALATTNLASVCIDRAAFELLVALVNVATPGSPRWRCGTVLNTDSDLWEIGTLEKRDRCLH